MSEPEESAGFLSRWSRRKIAAKEESPVPGEAGPLDASTGELAAPASSTVPADLNPESAPVPLPDIETLTPDGDFAPFMAKGVDAGTRNMAMKKLFTDPHYGFDNMDKLDIYLDDYSKPDPIPLDMLRGLNQAKRLFLFEDEEKPEAGSDVPQRAIPVAVPEMPEIAAPIETETPPETVIAESAQPK